MLGCYLPVAGTQAHTPPHGGREAWKQVRGHNGPPLPLRAIGPEAERVQGGCGIQAFYEQGRRSCRAQSTYVVAKAPGGHHTTHPPAAPQANRLSLVRRHSYRRQGEPHRSPCVGWPCVTGSQAGNCTLSGYFCPPPPSDYCARVWVRPNLRPCLRGPAGSPTRSHQSFWRECEGDEHPPPTRIRDGSSNSRECQPAGRVPKCLPPTHGFASGHGKGLSGRRSGNSTKRWGATSSCPR